MGPAKRSPDPSIRRRVRKAIANADTTLRKVLAEGSPVAEIMQQLGDDDPPASAPAPVTGADIEASR